MDRKVPDDFHALYDRGFRAARGALPAPSAQAETVGHERLAADVLDLAVDYDEATQLPNLVVSRRPAARLTAPSADSAEDAAVQFIQGVEVKEVFTSEFTAAVGPHKEETSRHAKRRARHGSFGFYQPAGGPR